MSGKRGRFRKGMLTNRSLPRAPHLTWPSLFLHCHFAPPPLSQRTVFVVMFTYLILTLHGPLHIAFSFFALMNRYCRRDRWNRRELRLVLF